MARAAGAVVAGRVVLHVTMLLLVGAALLVSGLETNSVNPAPEADAEEATTNLITLTSRNFDDVVLAREGPILVEFYSPYCGHCVTFAPELEKIANDLQVFLPMGVGRDQVDVTKQPSLRTKYNINGVPAIYLFGKDKEHPQVYGGRHDQRSVVQFVLNNVNHSCVTLTPALTALPRFLAKRDDTAGALPRIVYFDRRDSQDPPVQFASLAHTWADSALFGYVRGDESFVPSWMSDYHIDELPAVVVFSSVDLSETKITETWPAKAGANAETFSYRYTGSLANEAKLNDFCMEAGARSELYYESHIRAFGLSLNRSSFNLLFLVVVVCVGVGFVYWSRVLRRKQPLLPTMYPPSSLRNFSD